MRLRVESVNLPGEFTYSPRPWWDRVWWLLNPLLEKKSLWYHWVPYASGPRSFLKVFGDPKAGHEQKDWNTAVILQPMHRVDSPGAIPYEGAIPYVGAYRIGFRNFAGVLKICAVIIPAMQKVALLVGPEDVEFFAVAVWTSRPLELESIERTMRDLLPKKDAVLI